VDQRGVLLDDERREEPDSPPLKGVWAALAGVAVVVVIAVVTSSAANELDPPGSTLPDIPMVTVPPSMAEGEVVSRTLEWTKAVGLGDARQIGGVVEFRDLYWLFGTEDRGITVWTSTDGVRWSEEGPITITGDWSIDAVSATEDELAIAVSGWSTGRWKNFIFVSPDGSQWAFREVPLPEPQTAVTEFTAIQPVADGYLVQGWVGPNPVAQYLTEPFGSLLRDGHARAEVWPERVRIRLNPGLLVAEIPTADIPRFEPVIGVRERAIWTGDDLHSLDLLDIATSSEPVPQEIVRTPGGLYVGLSEGVLLTSPDGHQWELAPVSATAFDIAPWVNGIAAAGRSGAPFWWRPGTTDAEILLPPVLGFHPDRYQALAAGSEVGIAILERERPSGDVRPESRPVLVGDHSYRLQTTDGLAVLRDGEVVWSDRDPGSTARLVDQHIVFEGSGGSFSMPIDRWMAMTAPLVSPRPTPGPRVIHSLDGTRWSESTWDEITGRDTAGDVDLHAARGFVMVVGMSPDGDHVEAVAVGRATD